jgi:hypothetical protein
MTAERVATFWAWHGFDGPVTARSIDEAVEQAHEFYEERQEDPPEIVEIVGYSVDVQEIQAAEASVISRAAEFIADEIEDPFYCSQSNGDRLKADPAFIEKVRAAVRHFSDAYEPKPLREVCRISAPMGSS